MNDARLIALVAETDLYPDTALLPDEVAGVDEAFQNMLAHIDGGGSMAGASDAVYRRTVPVFGWRVRSAALAALAAFFLVIAVGVILFTLSRTPATDPANTPTTEAPTSTTVPATTEAAPAFPISPAGDVELAETAIAAWYANDFETFSQLADMPGRSSHTGWTPDDFRNHMAYDAVVGGGRDDPSCSEPSEAGGFFECRMPIENDLTAALGLTPDQLTGYLQVHQGDPLNTLRVVDGKLSRYEFHDHDWIVESFAVYLAIIDEFTGYEDCLRPPHAAVCGQIQMDRRDAWSEWSVRDSATAIDIARAHVEAVFAGDCQTVLLLTSDFDALGASTCPDLVRYEGAMGGTIALSNCAADPQLTVTCDASYRNVLSDAVGAPAMSTQMVVGHDWELGTWGPTDIRTTHPTDEALLSSVRTWAIDAGLEAAVDEQCGLATPRTTPECAGFLVDNLETWAAWYVANG